MHQYASMCRIKSQYNFVGLASGVQVIFRRQSTLAHTPVDGLNLWRAVNEGYFKIHNFIKLQSKFSLDLPHNFEY